MKRIADYINGNYRVQLFDNGTKIKFNKLDNLTPDFAESTDVTITTKCNGNCRWCYLCCTEKGQHADLNNPIFDTVHAGTEMAINGNDLSHPQLEEFLIKMKDKGVFVNITLNQKHIIPNMEKLRKWQDEKLIWGIGISLMDSTDPKLLECVDYLDNCIIHVIDGCITKEDLDNLSNHNIKMLILGFKHKGRGIEYYNQHKEEVDNNIQFLKDNLYDMYRDKYNGFGFDNLANEDLQIRQLVGEDNWNLHHMGEEGECTFFYDAVNNKFAISSMETTMYDGLDTFDDMFKEVRKLAGF